MENFYNKERIERLKQTIVPATNIKDFAKNMYPTRIIEPKNNHAVYVPLFDEVLDQIRDELLNGFDYYATFYLCGQTGSGKTTALNFIQNTVEFKQRFEVIKLPGRLFLDLDDLNVIDVLLMLAYRLSLHPKIKDQDFLLEQLDKLYQKYKGNLEEEKESVTSSERGFGAGISLGIEKLFGGLLKMGPDFFAKYSNSRDIRTTTREYFKFKEQDLVVLSNRILQRFLEILPDGKQILLIFDDLEKMSNAEQIKRLFVEDINLLQELRCLKIIPYPVSLSSNPHFPVKTAQNSYSLHLQLYKSVFSTQEDDEKIAANKRFLYDLVGKRMAVGVDLISEAAINLAINESGGLVRQFVQIVYQAATKVRGLGGKHISENDVERACQNLKKKLERPLIRGNKRALLAQVMDTKAIPEHEDFKENDIIEAIQTTQIIQHENGHPWYDVNPLLKDSIKYYKKTHKSE